MPAQSVRHQFPPTAASPKTIPRSAPVPSSPSPTAPPAIVRTRLRLHTPPRRVRWPIAAYPKTNAPPRQIPDRVRVANISSCASIRTPASPNLKSRNGDIPPRSVLSAPFRKIPPSRLRQARLRRCTAFPPPATPSPAGFLHPPPADTPTRAPAPAQSTPRPIASSSLWSGAAILQLNRNCYSESPLLARWAPLDKYPRAGAFSPTPPTPYPKTTARQNP